MPTCITYVAAFTANLVITRIYVLFSPCSTLKEYGNAQALLMLKDDLPNSVTKNTDYVLLP